MIKGQTSVRAGIEDLLCPFTYVTITQGMNGQYSHQGTMANDVGHKDSNNPYEEYYAPCDIKCVYVWNDWGQAMWQSVNKVRFADGSIDYLTFITVHDNSFFAKVGTVIKQGELMGHKGNKKATGVHCHIQCAKGLYTIRDWKANNYGNWCFPNEINIDNVFFFDNTELNKIPSHYKLKYLKDVVVEEPTPQSAKKILYLPASAQSWRVYPLNKPARVGNECGYLRPAKFGGLQYEVLAQPYPNVVTIQTRDYGKVNIYVHPNTLAVIK